MNASFAVIDATDTPFTLDVGFDDDADQFAKPEVKKPHAWRGDLGLEDVAFIAKQHYRGCSDLGIAKMLGRPVGEVSRLTAMMDPIAPRTLLRPQIAFAHSPPALSPLEAIVDDVAKKHRVRMRDMRGDTRIRTVVRARQEAFHEVYEMRRDDGSRRFSLPTIAHWFGGRDHTTVLHGIREHKKRLAEAAG